MRERRERGERERTDGTVVVRVRWKEGLTLKKESSLYVWMYVMGTHTSVDVCHGYTHVCVHLHLRRTDNTNTVHTPCYRVGYPHTQQSRLEGNSLQKADDTSGHSTVILPQIHTTYMCIHCSACAPYTSILHTLCNAHLT